MSALFLGIDAGNYRVKVAGPYGVDSYRSAICPWFQRNIGDAYGSDDMEFEIDGRRGYAGTIAIYENTYDDIKGMFGDSKAHDDAKVRVLLAIYRYLAKYAPENHTVKIVVGQPIRTHTASERESIIEMLVGEHEITVNGETRAFKIAEVGVAPEGSAAFWSAVKDGQVRIIDAGSGTVNCATLNDKRNVERASGTFNFGLETVGEAEIADTARAIVQATTQLKWRKTDAVYICGGAASQLLPYIAQHFTGAKLLSPTLRRVDGATELHDAVLANAIGFYEIARLVYGKAA